MAVLKETSYFFKDCIQLISMKWLENIETYLQFLDYRKNSEHIHFRILFWLC